MQAVDIEQIKRNADLLAIVGRDTILKRVATTRGGEYAGACPFCGGSDRFHVQPEKGLWWCRQCSLDSRWNDAVAYIQKRDHVDFKGAISQLSNHTQSISSTPALTERKLIKVPPTGSFTAALDIVTACERELWADKPSSHGALAWLHRRGLTDDTLKTWRIGFNPISQRINGLWAESGITIPYFDGKNVLHAINVRRPDSLLLRHLGADKYKMVRGSKRVLFGTNHLNDSPNILITEGEFDALLSWQEARTLVDVLTMGAAKGMPQHSWLYYLLGGQRFYIVTDNDPAGNDAAARWSELVGKRSLRHRPPSGKDITEYWQNGGNVRQWITDILSENSDLTTPSAPTLDSHDAPSSQAGYESCAEDLTQCRPAATAPVSNFSITIDQLVNGDLERQGWKIVGGDPDLYGFPWNPKIYVQPIAS